MKPRTLALVAALCLLGAVPSAAAASAPPSLLFVQQTQGGKLDRVGPGVYRLVLRDVSPTVSTFTDRPRRRAGEQGLTRFVKRWADNGFAADPPNAALVIRGAPGARDVAMLTLSHPRYDRRAGVLRYTAKPLHEAGAASLAGFTRRGDRVRSLSFGAASLFVDDAGADTSYVPLYFQVTPTAPMQMTRLEITSPDTYWSLGKPGSRGALILNPTPTGPLPLNNLTISPTSLAFQSGPLTEVQTSLELTVFVERPADAAVLTLDAEVGAGTMLEVTLEGLQSTITSGSVALPLSPS